MKIALVAPTEETVPPTKYGGTELIVYDIANGLAKKGHHVDLYAPGDSLKSTTYNLIPSTKVSLRHDTEIFQNPKLLEVNKINIYSKIAYKIQNENYDIVHNHASWRFLIFQHFIKYPIVTTHHGPLSYDDQNFIFKEYKNMPYVSISNNQRRDLPILNFVDTVYNGINLADLPFFTGTNNQLSYMSFLARVNKEKNPVGAAKVAQLTKHPLHIAAKVDYLTDPYYIELTHLIDNKYVFFEGEISPKEKSEFLSNSACLFVPIEWEEPFGLMFIEAMASGTPVITYARGSAPEIVKDGETGFLVNHSDADIRGNFTVKKTGLQGLCEAVNLLYSMPKEKYLQMRKAARKRVEDHFTVEKMVAGYERVYSTILS
jgi:glycosyltransferase involved in cell wall biosynthesis